MSTSNLEAGTTFKLAEQASHRLTVYRQILSDPICHDWLRLVHLAGGDCPEIEEAADLYHRLFWQLAEASESAGRPIVGDAWQNHLLDLILDADNPFTRQAESSPSLNIGRSYLTAAKNDLQCLETLFRLDAAAVRGGIAGKPDSPAELWPLWDEFASPAPAQSTDDNQKRLEIKQLLASTANWDTLLINLAQYYATAGVGLFGRYRAFRWVGGLTGEFLPIIDPDPIRFDDLIGYETEKHEIRQNTEKMLHGFPANNILLYGDRGTGKSSTVKALVNEYGRQGLRLIEVAKQELTDFPAIIRQLRHRPQYFILFVDDLSFEENELEYKNLKALLEGGVEARPANVLIYATSNRRHLIKERLSDRQVPDTDDEVRRNDTVQEKLSLADRFGLTIIFPSPNQDRYLAIAEGLADLRQLPISREDLRRRALQWEIWHNGRSGRTARQFIDHLAGELALGGQ